MELNADIINIKGIAKKPLQITDGLELIPSVI